MDTKILRSKILDLAIRGKLVPQDAADGSALDLLAQIGKERGCTIKPLTEDVPFDIPENWCWVNIDLINSYKSAGVNPLATPDEIFELYSVPTFESGEPEFLKGSEIGSSKQGVQSGDVLLCKINPHLNRVWSVDARTDKTLIASSEWIVIRCKETFPAYLIHCLSSQYFKELMLSNCSGVGGSLTRAQKNYVIRYPFPLPPLAEQKRIVAKVEELLAEVEKIEQAQKDIADSATILQSKVLDLAIRGKLVEQDAADGNALDLLAQISQERGTKITPLTENVPFEIPESWCWVKLGDVSESNIGLTYHPQDICDKGVPVYRSNNILEGRIITDDLVRVNCNILPKQYLHIGDVLICARNGSKRLVGKCAIIEHLPEKSSFGAFMAVCRSSYNRWIYNILNTEYFKRYLDESNSTTIHQVTQKMLLNFAIPLPPLAEQKRIVAKVEELLKEIDKLK